MEKEMLKPIRSRVPYDIKEAIKKIANNQGWSESYTVKYILEKWLKEN